MKTLPPPADPDMDTFEAEISRGREWQARLAFITLFVQACSADSFSTSHSDGGYDDTLHDSSPETLLREASIRTPREASREAASPDVLQRGDSDASVPTDASRPVQDGRTVFFDGHVEASGGGGTTSTGGTVGAGGTGMGGIYWGTGGVNLKHQCMSHLDCVQIYALSLCCKGPLGERCTNSPNPGETCNL